MKFIICPQCGQKNVYFRFGQGAGEDHYICRNKTCDWWVYAMPDYNDDWIALYDLQRINPDEDIVALPPSDAEIT